MGTLATVATVETAATPGTPGAEDEDIEDAQRRRWLILPVLCLSVFLVVVDNTIVNVALPTLNRELGASITGLQWIVDAYSLAFAGLLLAGGGIGDRLGRKGTMQVGLVFFGLFSRRRRGVPLDGYPDRRSCTHGCRGCVHLPGEPGHSDERFHRSVGTSEGARHLGCDVGHRRRVRPCDWRRVAPALLVRLDLSGERADRGRHPDRRTKIDPEAPEGGSREVRHQRGTGLDGRCHEPRAGDHRRTPMGLDVAPAH